MNSLPTEDVFTVARARADGCPNATLIYGARHGRVIRVRRGVYARPGVSRQVREDRAAALAYPGLPLALASAARLQGIPVVGLPFKRPAMTVPPRSNANSPGIHLCRARLREHEIVTVDGVLATSPARTVVDLARHYGPSTAVPALDHVLHERLASADEVLDVLEFCRRWPGAKRARRAARLCDSRAESALESVSRLVIARLGLPEPEPQVLIYDASGRLLARADFYWDEFGVVGEADGQLKYRVDNDVDNDVAAVVEAEKDREADLDEVRIEVTRWGWSRVWREQMSLERRIRGALSRGSDRDRAGLPRRWTAVSTPKISLF